MKSPLLICIFYISLSGVLAQENFQSIRGRVLDQDSKYPLIGATVVVVNSDPILGSSTDYDGYYRIEKVPYGRHDIKISYLGYTEKTIPNVLVTAGKEFELNVELIESVILQDEVVIKAKKDPSSTNNELALVSSRTFNVEETSRYAGSRNDPARMAQNFAGVGGGNDARNDIIIRGNSPIGVLWRLDGIDIPNPNHFGSLGTTGGPVSMLNNNLLSNSDFLTGAFPSEYGNAIAGVFDLQMRSGNRDEYEFLGQVGFNGFELGAEGPLPGSEKGSFLVNGRYSTLEVVDLIGLNIGTGAAVPQYKDASFKIDLPTEKAGRFSVFGLIGDSYIELLDSETSEDDSEDFYGSTGEDTYFGSHMAVVGLNHLLFLDEKTFSSISLAASTTGTNVKVDSLVINADTISGILPEYRNRFRQNRYSINYQINRKFNSRNTLRMGFRSDIYENDLKDSISTGFDSITTAQLFRTIRDVNGSATLLQTYAQLQHKFNDAITLSGGLHYQYFVLNGSNVIEPRLAVKYQFRNGSSINLGAGIHNQIQPLATYFVDTRTAGGEMVQTNRDLGFTQSDQIILGYERPIGKNMRFKVETYYQNLSNIPVEQNPSTFSMVNAGADFGIPDADSLANNGTGRNVGFEFTLERFLNNGYYFLLTSSVFDSKYKGSDGILRNTAFNSNFIVNGLMGREFKLNNKLTLAFDTRISYAGGNRYTPIDLDASRQSGNEVRPEENEFAAQHPDYFRMDFKTTVRINGQKIAQEWSVDLQNVTNKQNIFTQTYNPRTGGIFSTYQIGLFPVVQYRVLF